MIGNELQNVRGCRQLYELKNKGSLCAQREENETHCNERSNKASSFLKPGFIPSDGFHSIATFFQHSGSVFAYAKVNWFFA